MILLLVLNEGLPKAISENVFYLLKKIYFLGNYSALLSKPAYIFDCPSNNVFCIENRR